MIVIFIAGVCAIVGGVLPPLLNLAGQLVQDSNGLGIPGVGYWCGISIYGGAGLVVGLLFSNRTPVEAFKTALVAPAVVFSFINASPAGAGQNPQSGNISVTSHPSNSELISAELVSSAHAQNSNKLRISQASDRILLVYVNDETGGEFGDLRRTPINITFFTRGSGEALSSVPVVAEKPVRVVVPNNADQFEIKLGTITKRQDLLPVNSIVNIDIESATSSFKQQLWWGFSGKRSGTADNIDVGILPIETR